MLFLEAGLQLSEVQQVVVASPVAIDVDIPISFKAIVFPQK